MRFSIINMLRFLFALFPWLTMITVSMSDPLDTNGDSYNFDKRLLGEDPQDIYNKTLASKSSTPSRLPPAVPFSTPKYSGPPIVADGVDAASHPPNRGVFFTPPLPKDQFNFPFADKPTLRGSNSENAAAGTNRRPHVPPIVPGKTGEKERIPIKRPDLLTPPDAKKKTINTPSGPKLPEALNYSEPSSSPSSTTAHNINNTLDIVVPAVHNISYTSILRILHNGNNKHDFVESNKPRLEPELKSSKTAYSNGNGAGISSSSIAISKTSSSSTMASTTAAKSVSVSSYGGDDDDDDDEVTDDGGGKEPPQIIYAYPPASNNIEQREISFSEQRTKNDNVNHHPSVKSSSSSVHESTEITNAMPERPEPRARYILGIAWDIHVYLVAILFAILACVSFVSLVRAKGSKWLLPCGYFFAVHILLTLIGGVRSVYLFYDAYNISKSFSEPISRLMLNIVSPFLVCIFSLMFLFILKIVDLKTDFYYARRTSVLLALVLVYTIFSVYIDLCGGESSTLILLSQCLFVFVCVLLGVAYIVFYKYASRSSLRKQNSVYGTAFTDPLRPSLAHAIRVMLAISLLSLLMAAIQLIGMFCMYDASNKDHPHPWLWWAFQLSVRVIEVSICFLAYWAAVQPLRGEDEKETQSHNSASGFPLFPWGAGGTPRGSDHGGHGCDDIYPTICNANQAIHNYTLRTGKQVYEDIFQYCNAPPPPPPPPLTASTTTMTHTSGHSVTPVPTQLLSHTTTERRSFKRHAYPLDAVDPLRSACGTLAGYPPERRPLPSPSMLIDEKGIVRFRSIADAELHAEDSFSRIHLNHSNDNYSSS